nr:toxin glutamine deamidase domain-containing protein [Streptomyces anthocyanicus]
MEQDLAELGLSETELREAIARTQQLLAEAYGQILTRETEKRGPRLSEAALTTAVDEAIASIADLEGTAPDKVSQANCVTLLQSLERRLYSALEYPARLEQSSGRTAVRPAVTLDDLALATRDAEQRLARGPGWGPVTSWESLATAVSNAGTGATGLVIVRRSRGPGHAFALHHTVEGIRWIELQAPKHQRVTSILPTALPYQARAIVVNGDGQVLAHAMGPKHGDTNRTVDALTDPPDQPEVIGKIGIKVEDRHPLWAPPDVEMLAKTVLATHDSGAQIEVEIDGFYLGRDQRLYGSMHEAHEASGGGREQHYPIAEFVASPMGALSQDTYATTRSDGLRLMRRFRELLRAADSDQGSVPFGELFGRERGWTVTDEGRNVTVHPAPSGAHHAAYTQFTVGIPAGGLKTVLELVEEHLDVYDLIPLMETGRRFGEHVAASYASAEIGRHVRSEDVPFLTDLAGLDEISGYAWLTFLHVAGRAAYINFLRPRLRLTKSVLAVALRNPFHLVHEALSPVSRNYLLTHHATIQQLFETDLQTLITRYAAREGTEEPEIDAQRAMAKESRFGTLRNYLHYALTGATPDGRHISQYDVFGLEDVETLDTTRDGVGLALLEFRDYAIDPELRDPRGSATDMTEDAVQVAFDQIAEVANRAYRRATRFSASSGINRGTAEVILADPTVRAVRDFVTRAGDWHTPGPQGTRSPVLLPSERALLGAAVAGHAVGRPLSRDVQRIIAEAGRKLEWLQRQGRISREDLPHLQRTVSAHQNAMHCIQPTVQRREIPTPYAAHGTRHRQDPRSFGRGEPPVAATPSPVAAVGNETPEDRYAPLLDTEQTRQVLRLIHVPERVEQPVAARMELARALDQVLKDPGIRARVVDSGARVYVVPRDVPLVEIMRSAGVVEPLPTHDGRPAHTLRAYTDLGARSVFISEENLLGERGTFASNEHPDGYSSTLHEIAHLLWEFLTEEDRTLVQEVFDGHLAEDPSFEWVDGPRQDTRGESVDNYSSLDPEEFFAQITNAYFHANTGHDPLTGRPRNNGTGWIQDNEPGLLPLLTRVYGTPTPHHPYNPTTRTAAENSIWQGFADFFELTQHPSGTPADAARQSLPVAVKTPINSALHESGQDTEPENDGEVPVGYAWLERVNPYREQGGEFRTNCVLAAVAVDMSLAEGAVFQAPPSGLGEEGAGLADTTGLTVYLGRYRDMDPYPVPGPAAVLEAMSQAAPGQRGMVVTQSPGGEIAHVINVVRDDNGVVFLDGQAGALVPLPADAQSFLPTTDAIPGFPLDRKARTAAPATQPRPLGAIGTETEFQFPLTLDEEGWDRLGSLFYNDVLAYYTPLSFEQADNLDDAAKVFLPQIKVDNTTVFRGEGGVAAMSAYQIEQMTGKQPTGHMDVKIPELVLPPMQVLQDEGNRFRPQRGMELRASVQQGLSGAHFTNNPIPLRDALGSGWVVTDIGQYVLVGKALTGPRHPAYTQFTVGVPTAGLSTVLRLVEERLPSEFSDFAPILSAGRRFADSLVRSYARRRIGSVELSRLPFLGGVAGLDELHGYAWLMFEHVAAKPVAVIYLRTLAKVAIPALSRVSFHEIHAALPEGIQAFLRNEEEWIVSKFTDHLDELLKGYHRTSHPSERLDIRRILGRRITSKGTTVGDYFRYALSGETADSEPITQSDVLEIADFPMDDNSGRLANPLVLLELRNFGKGLTTQEEMDALFRELSAVSQRAYDTAEQTWSGPPSSAAGRVLADPLVNALIRVFDTTAELEQRGIQTFSPAAREYLARDAGAAAGHNGSLSAQTQDMLTKWEEHFANQVRSWPYIAPSRVPVELLPQHKAVHEALRIARKAAQQKRSRSAGRSRRVGALLGDRSSIPPLVSQHEAGPAAFGVPVVSARVLREVPVGYAWLERVNPYREQGGEFRTNCVLAAVAVDMSLAEGAVFQAPPSGLGEEGAGLADTTGLTVYLGRYRDMDPYPVPGPAAVLEAMSQAAPGQRGMVVTQSPGGEIAHVINVVRDDNGVVFLDGQAGALVPLPADAQSFLPTTDAIPGFPLDRKARTAAPATQPRPLGAIGTEVVRTSGHSVSDTPSSAGYTLVASGDSETARESHPEEWQAHILPSEKVSSEFADAFVGTPTAISAGAESAAVATDRPADNKMPKGEERIAETSAWFEDHYDHELGSRPGAGRSGGKGAQAGLVSFLDEPRPVPRPGTGSARTGREVNISLGRSRTGTVSGNGQKPLATDSHSMRAADAGDGESSPPAAFTMPELTGLSPEDLARMLPPDAVDSAQQYVIETAVRQAIATIEEHVDSGTSRTTSPGAQLKVVMPSEHLEMWMNVVQQVVTRLHLTMVVKLPTGHDVNVCPPDRD